MGAPPTAAQLGSMVPGPMPGSYGSTGPMAGPPIFSGGGFGQSMSHPSAPGGAPPAAPVGAPPPHPPPSQYLPQLSQYRNPYSGGQSYGQPFGHRPSQAPQPPAGAPSSLSGVAAHPHGAHGSAQHQPLYGGGPHMSVVESSSSNVAGSAARVNRPGASMGGGPPTAVYNVFNPTTDCVVAADSTSSSVL